MEWRSGVLEWDGEIQEGRSQKFARAKVGNIWFTFWEPLLKQLERFNGVFVSVLYEESDNGFGVIYRNASALIEGTPKELRLQKELSDLKSRIERLEAFMTRELESAELKDARLDFL